MIEQNVLYAAAELSLYWALTLLAVFAALYLMARTWLMASQAKAQDQYNQMEWEQQRQQAARIDRDSAGIGVHVSTAQFYRVDDE